MPDITFPNAWPADGAVADADEIMDNLWRQADTPDSIEVMNGRLSDANRATWDVSRQMVRRGHFSEGRMVGATANIDFFSGWFPGFSGVDADMVTVPGGSVELDLKFNARMIMLFWHVELVVDVGATTASAGVDSTGDTVVKLFLDGDGQPTIRRIIRDGLFSMAYDPAAPGVYLNEFIQPDSRFWSGCVMVAGNFKSSFLTKGRHTASIRLATDGDAVRVKTRRMGYVAIY